MIRIMRNGRCRSQPAFALRATARQAASAIPPSPRLRADGACRLPPSFSDLLQQGRDCPETGDGHGTDGSHSGRRHRRPDRRARAGRARLRRSRLRKQADSSAAKRAASRSRTAPSTAASCCPASTDSGSSPGSTVTSTTPCRASRSATTRGACSTTSSRRRGPPWRGPGAPDHAGVLAVPARLARLEDRHPRRPRLLSPHPAARHAALRPPPAGLADELRRAAAARVRARAVVGVHAGEQPFRGLPAVPRRRASRG